MSNLKKVMEKQRLYFQDCREEINSRNIQLIRTVSIVSSAVYIVYLLFTIMFFKNKEISLAYGLIVPIMAVFFMYARNVMKNKDTSKAPLATLILYIVSMSYIIMLSVFPHPDLPCVYFPLFLMLAPVMFMMPFYQHIILSLLSLAGFIALVVNFKNPSVWSHELFEAVTAEVFSLIVILFMAQFRIQSDSLKTMYYEISREDKLTGIMNKAAGQEAIINYLEHKKLNEKCALVFLDIDNFKYINDNYGHLIGDEILQKIGNTLNENCREGDIVCRFGGDEFMVAFKKIRDAEHVKARAEQILKAISSADLPDNINVTCSIGISVSNEKITTFNDIIRLADEGLYEAKKKGKNCYAFSPLENI